MRDGVAPVEADEVIARGQWSWRRHQQDAARPRSIVCWIRSRNNSARSNSNLFLSRDKQLGRKLQELAITFLLESALGKDRILEIYLRIIE
jgi:hypothetical protein